MTPNEYQSEALRTVPSCLSGRSLLLMGVMGLAGESGEAVDLVKKYVFHEHDLDQKHLAKELGDVAWYLAVTAATIGYDLEEILRMNVDKLRKRYPDGFDPDRSNHRSPDDI